MPETLPTPKRAARGRRSRGLVAAVLVLALLLGVKVLNYASPKTLRADGLADAAQGASASLRDWYARTPAFHSCAAGTKVELVDGYVCSDATGTSVYDRIFTTYRLVGGDRAMPYPDLLKPDRDAADALVAGRVEVPRYSAVALASEADWSSQEGRDAYWRFYYYGLRHAIPLALAYTETGRPEYLDTLRKVLGAFEANDDPVSPMWSDAHAVAYRAMTLTWLWWTLREQHALDAADSATMLAEIQRTGAFLADPAHYQPQYNHGLTEAIALADIALNFPELPDAAAWQSLALQRLEGTRAKLTDADGSLVENSPYDHITVLAKLWRIRTFLQHHQVAWASALDPTIDSMVDVATFLLRPDGSIPELGASLPGSIRRSGAYAEIADAYPGFAYVITGGQAGTPPALASRSLRHTGLTVFRSPWTRDAQQRQSYLTFNVGAYRTQHSHLDLLGVTLFDDGASLLPDAGLYTYSAGPEFDYFHGTGAHNTVVVDGADQRAVAAQSSEISEVDGVTVQSAGTSEAYLGVNDARTVAMVDPGVFLVVDRLDSAADHTYDQTWHLAPGATVSSDAASVTARLPGGQSVTIKQLDAHATTLFGVPSSRTEPVTGLCATAYAGAAECARYSFRQWGTTASFVTLITVGDAAAQASYDAASGVVRLATASGERTLTLSSLPGVPRTVQSSPLASGRPELTPLLTGPWTTLKNTKTATFEGTGAGVTLSATGAATATASFGKPVDLTTRDLRLRVRVRGITAGSYESLVLRSASGVARLNLRALISADWDGDWVDLTVPTGATANLRGRWEGKGDLDWTRVTSLEVERRDRVPDTASGVDIATVATSPKQPSPLIAIVFDDGYNSVLKGAEIMHERGLPGTISVIGAYLKTPRNPSHLSVLDLHKLQDDWGWTMVNHTEEHLDIVAAYGEQAGRTAFEADLLSGQQALREAGLDSTPNWFVYPRGSTTSSLDSVVSQYYTFARTTLEGMDAYPFSSPLRVHNFEVHNPGDSPGTTELTTPDMVARAVADAKASRSTMIITFHRIASAENEPGYPVEMFRQCMDTIAASGVKVTTLSGLDAAYGLTGRNDIRVDPGRPTMTGVTVSEFRPASRPFDLLGWLKQVLG